MRGLLAMLTFMVLWPAVFFLFFIPYFHGAFVRYEIYHNFPNYSQAQVNSQFNSVLQYLRFGGDLDTTFFSSEDILHLNDVRNLYSGVYVILLIAVVVLILDRKKMIQTLRAERSRKILRRLILTIPLAALCIGIFWDQIFLLFHQVLFPMNDYWQLDPTTSHLIRYLPVQVFQELAVLYLGIVLIQIVAWNTFQATER